MKEHSSRTPSQTQNNLINVELEVMHVHKIIIIIK